MSIAVSVIIPVYNVEQYLNDCIQSVLSQTLEEIEVICVEDCSTDGSMEVLKSLTAKTNRVKVIRHKINSGLAAARNTGLDQASGCYVFFLDSDDLLFSEGSLEHLFKIATEDNADEVIGGILRWEEQKEERVLGYHANYLKNDLRSVKYKDYPYLSSNVTACNKLIKSSFLLSNEIRFNSELKKFEDNPFSCKVHLLAKSISLSTQSTYIHRIRDKSNKPSLTQSYDNDYLWHSKAGKDISLFLNRKEIDDSLRYFFDRRIFYWLDTDVSVVDKNNPTCNKRQQILNTYLPLLSDIPKKSLEDLPQYYREVLALLAGEEWDRAWQYIVKKNEHESKGSNVKNMKDRKNVISQKPQSENVGVLTFYSSPLFIQRLKRLLSAVVRLITRPVSIVFSFLVIGIAAFLFFIAVRNGSTSFAQVADIIGIALFAETVVLFLSWIFYTNEYKTSKLLSILDEMVEKQNGTWTTIELIKKHQGKLALSTREIRKLVNTRTVYLDGKIKGVSGKIKGVSGRIGGLDGKIGGLDGKIGGLDGRIGGLDGRIGGVEENVELFNKKIGYVRNLLEGIDKSRIRLGHRPVFINNEVLNASKYVTLLAPYSGLADRLLQLAPMIAICTLLNKKLRLLWPVNQYCNGSLKEVYDLEFEYVDLSKDILRQKGIAFRFNNYSYLEQNLDSLGQNIYQYEQGADYTDVYENFKTLLHDLAITKEDFRRITLHSLNELELRKSIADSVARLEKKFKKTIGIHYRRTDKIKDGLSHYNIDKKSIEVLYDDVSMNMIENQMSPDVSFFLACDDIQHQESIQEFIEERGYLVYTHEKTFAGDFRQTSLEDAVIDLYLLSKCKYIVACASSRFSQLAAMIGNIEIISQPVYSIVGKETKEKSDHLIKRNSKGYDFTVIVTSYNTKNLLARAVESALNQTLENVEVIVIDDASTDPETIHSIEELPSSVDIIRLDKNRGVSYCRNTGIKRASSPYILCLDGDDYIEPEYLEKAKNIFDERKDVGIVSCYVKAVGQESWTWKPSENISIKDFLTRNQLPSASCFRRKASLACGLYEEGKKLSGFEDWDHWLKLFKNGWQIEVIKEYMFFYHRQPGTMITRSMKKVSYAMEKLFGNHKELYYENYEEVIANKHEDIYMLSEEIRKLKTELRSKMDEKELRGRLDL